jgi:hypothetical protein
MAAARAGPVLVIVGVAGEVAGGADLTQPQTAIHAVAHAGVMSLLTLILGITAVMGEYRYKTINDAYLATPTPRPRDRRQVRCLHRRRCRLQRCLRRHRGLPRRVDPPTWPLPSLPPSPGSRSSKG